MPKNQISVLFVCLGNICRSPLAEGIFRHLVEKRQLQQQFLIDSCGTGSWHVGELPHRDSREVAKKNGISLAGQRARQVADQDFYEFDYLVAMDRSNLADLNQINTNPEASIILLREYDPEKGLDVPDPYYEGGFDGVFSMIHRSCLNLLDELLES